MPQLPSAYVSCATNDYMRPIEVTLHQRLSRLWDRDRTRSHRAVTLLVTAINVCWLLPLATLTVYYPDRSFLWVTVAYVPLIIGTLLVGAGLPDHTPPPFKELLKKRNII